MLNLMNAGSPSPTMSVAPTFWPFAYAAIKPFEVPIHPAFLHTHYRNYPLQYSPQTVTHGMKTKLGSFTIDAILNKNSLNDSDKVKTELDEVKQEQRHADIPDRRQQRVLDATHPYLTSQTHSGHQLSHESQRRSNDLTPKEKHDKKQHGGSSDWKQGKSKRVRTIFTPDQLERLESEFERQQYMVGTERYYLASTLNLTEAQVKVWFQNRRIKWRKQNLEQQQAKLATLDLYKDVEYDSDSESDDENNKNNDDNDSSKQEAGLSLHLQNVDYIEEML